VSGTESTPESDVRPPGRSRRPGVLTATLLAWFAAGAVLMAVHLVHGAVAAEQLTGRPVKAVASGVWFGGLVVLGRLVLRRSG
jgi:putative copper export protein